MKMSYNNVHRFLLRSIASRGVMILADTLRALAQYTDSEHDSVQELIKEINDEIRPYQQTIKMTTDELTDEVVLVFMSLGSDDATKAQNFFSANELEFFRLLIEQIMTTDSRQVTRIHALNLVGSMKGSFTKTDAEKLLKTWCRMRYLDKDNNNYVLGVRAIHEFEGYLRQNMPDAIEECCLCKQIVFRGYNCPACAIAVHTRCLNRYLEKVKKWPCCKVEFTPEQLEQLNCETSRLSQSQRLETTQQLEPNPEETQNEEFTENMDLTQGTIIPEISQRITRKRKRQC